MKAILFLLCLFVNLAFVNSAWLQFKKLWQKRFSENVQPFLNKYVKSSNPFEKEQISGCTLTERIKQKSLLQKFEENILLRANQIASNYGLKHGKINLRTSRLNTLSSRKESGVKQNSSKKGEARVEDIFPNSKALKGSKDEKDNVAKSEAEEISAGKVDKIESPKASSEKIKTAATMPADRNCKGNSESLASTLQNGNSSSTKQKIDALPETEQSKQPSSASNQSCKDAKSSLDISDRASSALPVSAEVPFYREAANLPLPIVKAAFDFLYAVETENFANLPSSAISLKLRDSQEATADIFVIPLDCENKYSGSQTVIIVHRFLMNVASANGFEFRNDLHITSDNIWTKGLKETLKKYPLHQHIHVGYGSGAALASLAARRSVTSAGLLASLLLDDGYPNTRNQVLVLGWDDYALFSHETARQYPIRRRNHLRFLISGHSSIWKQSTGTPDALMNEKAAKFVPIGRLVTIDCRLPAPMQQIPKNFEKAALNRLPKQLEDDADLASKRESVVDQYRNHLAMLKLYHDMAIKAYAAQSEKIYLRHIYHATNNFGQRLSTHIFQALNAVVCSVEIISNKQRTVVQEVLQESEEDLFSAAKGSSKSFVLSNQKNHDQSPSMTPIIPICKLTCTHKDFPAFPIASYLIVEGRKDQSADLANILAKHTTPPSTMVKSLPTNWAECMHDLFKDNNAWSDILPLELSDESNNPTFFISHTSKKFDISPRGIMMLSMLPLYQFASIYAKNPKLFFQMIDFKGGNVPFPPCCSSLIVPVYAENNMPSTQLREIAADYLMQAVKTSVTGKRAL